MSLGAQLEDLADGARRSRFDHPLDVRARPRESACEGNSGACVPAQLDRITQIDVAPLRG
jgi:hypothetical protein